MKFKHIIITRFNLPKRWDCDKQGKNILDDEWLINRYDLFEKYCFPSIKGQTVKNFEWWVYFDSYMSEENKEKNKKLKIYFPNFIPRYENSYDDFELNMPKDIYKYISTNGIDWLITTRLDNDDMLAKDTIGLIQKGVNFDDTVLLELPHGYTLELGILSNVKKVNSSLNPFISLVENVSDNKFVKSVYYYQHNNWKDITRVIISKKIQWVQIIHEKNISNSFKGEMVIPIGIKKQFKFNDDDLQFQPLYILFIKRLFFLMKRIINKFKMLLKKVFNL